MKKSFWVVIILLLILSAFPLASQAAPLTKLSWRAEYFDNPNLSGQPQLSIFEAQFGHDWGYGSPAPEIPVDHFSARFTRKMHFEKGTYLFLMTVDDGARVWLDGKMIIDAWNIGRKEQVKAKIRLDTTGDHEIQVAYFEHTGPASIQLEWVQLGGENDIVGAWTGEYFGNRNLTGAPVMTRQDSGINFDWNSGSPHPRVPRDNFSVRWTRSIYLPAGHYTFRVQHDDGMRVYIDDKIIYDSWFDQQVSYEVGIVPIKEGYRTLRVEFYDHVGNAIARFTIDEDPGDYTNTVPDPNEQATIVDNSDPGFMWYGPSPFEGRGGLGGNFVWTYNRSTTAVSVGKWMPSLPAAGNYEVFAYIPANRSTSRSATYRIQHFGRVAARTIDQNRYQDEFVSLGMYYFDARGNEFATLQDNTGEGSGSTQLAFDAVKFVKR